MSKAAQLGQEKNGNLNCCAYSVRKINGRAVAFTIWGGSRGAVRANIAVSKLPELIAQLDAALAAGELCVTVGGAAFAAEETLLREIRADFSSLVSSAIRAGNDAHVRADSAAKRRGKQSNRQSVRARSETGASISSHNGGEVYHRSSPRLSAGNAEGVNLINPQRSGGGGASNRAGRGSPAAPAAQRLAMRKGRTSLAVNL